MKDEFMENGFLDEQIEGETLCSENLSPEERLDMIATILAIAAMRFKHRRAAEKNK